MTVFGDGRNQFSKIDNNKNSVNFTSQHRNNSINFASFVENIIGTNSVNFWHF